MNAASIATNWIMKQMTEMYELKSSNILKFSVIVFFWWNTLKNPQESPLETVEEPKLNKEFYKSIVTNWIMNCVTWPKCSN